MKRLILFAILALLALRSAGADPPVYSIPTVEGTGVTTATLEVTPSNAVNADYRGEADYLFTLTANSGGTVTMTLPTGIVIKGIIGLVAMLPGTAAPSASWSATLKTYLGSTAYGDQFKNNGVGVGSATAEVDFTPYSSDGANSTYTVVPLGRGYQLKAYACGSGKQVKILIRMIRQ